MDSSAELPTEDLYRLLVDAVMDYAIYLLDINGQIISWNTGAERFKGYSADEIIGQHFSVFYTEEERAAGMPQSALATAKKDGRFEAEGWRVRKNGTRFWCSVVIDPVYDDKKQLIGFAKITRDITEQKSHREQLQAARDSMHHAQRMEAIGRLTGGVAHDFNNFLTAIRFSAEFLKRSKDLPESMRHYVDVISDTTERAAQLTRQLLAYARKQPLQPHVFDVRENLSSLRQLFEASVGSSIALTYELGPGNCTIFADPGQLESALLNLVINARDAMPTGGTLTIAVHHIENIPASTAASNRPEGHVALSVRDTGVGIEPDILAHVFDPFFSTKDAHENSGLGLSQVQGFVRQSGGDVRVQSTPGQGTEFTLYLPAAKAPQPIASTSLDSDLIRNIGVRNDILLVEDNLMVGEVVFAMLKDLGQRPIWLKDAPSALRALEDNNGRFDIALLDVVLPGMNGVDLAKRIRVLWPGIHIVLASGYSDVITGPEAVEFPVMQKPYSLDMLTQVLVKGSRQARSGSINA
ncbi:ATP-binding protein [Bordetella genomosp. 4]|uniref:histidine kinase n=1 Tax=Bordetella genomosp. 4 TaxID=463044 RepID=A0A261TTH3_9BORD|nr:ATP-binding protein [Bordetella genomosp. 4]OZI44323.1 hybrid sensor histidine kinase/response regulator [Bordetella genomosp. 4]OZI52956.1 hybrid sensor histidine kinase/response regulator [Bordetella genomosp. 4]